MSFVDVFADLCELLFVVLDVVLADADYLLVICEVAELLKSLHNPFLHNRILQLNNLHRLHLMRKLIPYHINLPGQSLPKIIMELIILYKINGIGRQYCIDCLFLLTDIGLPFL